MARRTETIVIVVDDLDGKAIEDGSDETVKFSLDGSNYEIDLSTENARALRDAFKPYVKAARPATARRGVGGNAKTDKANLNAMREWARANGYEVSDRGRIPKTIQDAYRASK